MRNVGKNQCGKAINQENYSMESLSLIIGYSDVTKGCKPYNPEIRKLIVSKVFNS